jgi:toxin ParE1/3/4
VTRRLRRSEAAESDLDDIWSYIAADSPAAADRVILRILAAEDRLAEFPELAAARPEMRPGLRIWPVGAYLMLYRVDRDAVEIVRIVHGARNLGQALDET